MTLRPAASDVNRSLNEIDGLDDPMRRRILRKLHADGLLFDDRDGALFAAADSTPPRQYSLGEMRRAALLTPMQAAAADPANRVILDQVVAQCRRFGFDLRPGEIVDTMALDRALSKSRDVSGRMALKATMSRLHLIP